MFHVKPTDLLALTRGIYRQRVRSIAGLELPLLPFFVAANLGVHPVMVVLPDKASAVRVLDDLTALGLGLPVMFVGSDRVDGIDTGQSNRALRALLAGDRGVYVVPAAELLGGVSSSALEALELRTGQNYVLQDLEQRLLDFGFEKDAFVVEPGYFSVRGGVLDLFPGDQEQPVRLDFLGNQLESISSFDPASQRSDNSRSTLSVFPENPFEQPQADPLLGAIPDAIRVFQFRPLVANSDSLTLMALLGRDRPTRCTFLLQTSHGFEASLNIEPQPDFQRNLDAFKARLDVLNTEQYRVFLCADSSIQLDRLKILFSDYSFQGVRLSLSAGFMDHTHKLAVLTDHQIFGRNRKRIVLPRNFPARPATHISAFEEGEFVVHLDYGIAKYLGVELIPVNKTTQEVLALEYQAGDRVYVPVEKMHRVHKYESQLDTPPRLTRLRTTDWEQIKLKTRRAVDNYARQLMKLYANRFVVEGYKFNPDTDFQKQLEASFEFDETADQLTAVADIKRDMESAFPMDRLLCGDVGFGKTEVAMRAAFKAVNDSRQVGVLVPTTILAQQHYETFLERFEDYPVTVDVLSRFRSPKQIRATLKGLKSGSVDIVVGTHRLLSKDVVFKQLGLLIVDEEHRFGVKHKERVKELKTSVDALSMTATPIPRTLQMSLMGARDLSMLKTPPRDRHPIETVVMDFDERRIQTAILREVDRGGQVFFVHNRVESIGVMLSRLQALLPDVSFGLGHGQMKPRDLERVMLGFFNREFDVLLSTTIVESGLDIPNANTLIVNRADAMGLSQLYQLRGRVGRSHRQAWAYFLAPGFRKLSLNAIKRLNALERHAHYGGGYEIAMRDLEIRGSGNVFGTEQSGHIVNIGYHLYTKILKDTLDELREHHQHEQPVFPVPDISIDVALQIPASFIENTAERIADYRRIADATSVDDLYALRGELRERFGLLPAVTNNLFDAALVKVLGQQLGLRNLLVKQDRVQGDFLPEYVEHAGAEIIKGLSKALGITGKTVEIMNNRSLTFIISEHGSDSPLASLRIFLESLLHPSNFFDHDNIS